MDIVMKLLSNMLRNWKTSTVGAAGVLVVIAQYFGVALPNDMAQKIMEVLVFVGFLFAKDSDKMGKV